MGNQRRENTTRKCQKRAGVQGQGGKKAEATKIRGPEE